MADASLEPLPQRPPSSPMDMALSYMRNTMSEYAPWAFRSNPEAGAPMPLVDTNARVAQPVGSPMARFLTTISSLIAPPANAAGIPGINGAMVPNPGAQVNAPRRADILGVRG